MVIPKPQLLLTFIFISLQSTNGLNVCSPNATYIWVAMYDDVLPNADFPKPELWSKVSYFLFLHSLLVAQRNKNQIFRGQRVSCLKHQMKELLEIQVWRSLRHWHPWTTTEVHWPHYWRHISFQMTMRWTSPEICFVFDQMWYPLLL